MSKILQNEDKGVTAKIDPKTSKKGNNPKTSDVIKLNKKRKKRNFRRNTGYIYIGRIPHGFYEDQMSAYFNQFGKVISAYVPRSKKTGRSKGYGFVEFEDEDVAKIAAETMNNYLMYNKVLKCRYIPPEERRHISKRSPPLIPPRTTNRRRSLMLRRQNLSKLSLQAYQKKTEAKMLEFKKFFDERGIEFNVKLKSSNTKNSNFIDKAAQTQQSKLLIDSQDETDEYGVLEIDASDTEIYFQTPPKVKKVIKKSSSTSGTSQDDSSQSEGKSKEKKIKKLKFDEPIQANKYRLVKKITKTSKKKQEAGISLCEEKSDLLKRRKSLVKQKKLKGKDDDSQALTKEKNKRKSNRLKQTSKKSSLGRLGK